jgi:hypothetical protein
MKTYGGVDVDPCFPDLGTSWRRVASFTLRSLYPRGKIPQYALDKRLGGPQGLSGLRGAEKILYPTETRTPIPARPDRSQ